MLPLFVAVDTVEEDAARPKLDWNKVDFVTDRNNLMKLSGFFLRKLSNSRTFRIDIELVGRTVVMQRWEERSVVWVKTGYGDSFERESTSPGPGCENSTLAGHTRIVSYVGDQCLASLNHVSPLDTGLFGTEHGRQMRSRCVLPKQRRK